MTYVELHAHSAFSFLDGASAPAELAVRAERLGYDALALTDHDGVWGSMEFAQACRGLSLRPIVGAELTLEGGAHLTLLVESQAGYRNLCRLLTAAHSHTRDGPRRLAGRPRVTLERVEEHAEGLVCLSGCARDGVLAGAWARGEAPAAVALGGRLRAAFGRDRFRVELQRPYWRRDRARNRWLAQLAERLGVPSVATGDVHCHDPARARLQDAFVAVRLGTTLEASEPERRGNSSSVLVSPRRMAERFAEHPEAVAETVRLADRLRFDLTTELGYRYPGSEDPHADRELAEVCRARLVDRYEDDPEHRRHRAEAGEKLERELATIRALGLSGFFLLHREILELAREVAVQVRGPDSARSVLPPGRGRGSSVSSIVCYLTGLSHIDPVQKGLFSGRFLNEEIEGATSGRTMPDIDLDFPRDIREVLIRRVHEVYGAERAALVAAFPTYRPRGAVRDLGKALALPADEIERVAKTIGFHERAGEIERAALAAIGRERLAAPGWRALLALCGAIVGLPRHPSQHPGGMVISTRPLIDVCPVVPAAMEGRQIVQWDKDSCADAGFLKIDLLGLGMLSAVERCVDEVRRTRDERLDLSRIDFEDRETFESIQRAETTGVFQIESRAQMQMLPRTLPRNLDDLTTQVALVRPGPIQGGAIHPYIERRKLQREDPSFEIPYAHPLLREALEETLGTIVYQEQVLEVARALAGFSSAEAESLRRAMSRKRSEEAIARHHRRFIEGAGERGVSRSTAQRVWEEIQGFSGFGFPKAHSAAFGLLAYQSAWLRVHRAPEFLCALLNEQPMGFYPPDALVHEAQRRGVRIAAPDANLSRVLCHVERPDGGLRVRIGLGYVKGVREEEMESLVAAREKDGPYLGVADLASRSGAGRDGLERLAWAGALDAIPLAHDRRAALWQAGIAPTARGAGEGTQLALPLEPPAPPALEPLGGWETMIADYRSTGMALGEHPMSMLRDGLGPSVLRSADLGGAADGSEVEVAGMVVARQRPETAKGIVFMLFEDETGVVNLIVPPPVYERHRALVRAAPLLRARGRLERREGVTNVLVSEVAEVQHSAAVATPRLGDHPRHRAAHLARPPAQPARESRGIALRRRAVAELRAVAPAGHSWGRRGR
jgi:error-prone DNA polymerase